MVDTAETADSEALKEKIRKVLALLEGAKTEGEARSASLALQRLLAKGGLTVEDVIAEGERGEEDVVENICESGGPSCNWKVSLAKVIARNFRCELYMKSRGQHRRVVFVGFEDDTLIASGCYYATIKAAQRCYREYCRRMRTIIPDLDSSKALIRNGFYYGFVEGLDDAYREQVESSDELAIVLQTPAAVRSRMDEIRKRLTPNPLRSCYVSEGSFSAGKRDGYGFGRSDRLEG